VGGVIEDNARLTHFFAKLDSINPATGKHFTPPEAALSVKKYLFNYNELTDFEQAFMRRAAPFYAWTRFNIPLQLRGLVERPENYAAIGDIINATERHTPKPRDEDQLVAEWMKANTAVRVRQDEKGNPEYLLLGGWLPAADIQRVFRSVKEIGSQLGPWKVPAEMALNKDAFLGQDIESFPGEKEKFLGLPLSKRWIIQPLKQLRLLTEIDRVLAAAQEAGAFGDTKITNRHGDDIGSTAMRILFGFKLYPVNELRRRRELRRNRQKSLRELRFDRLRRGGVNQETLRELAENPELFDN
jgi:hypothetical protein